MRVEITFAAHAVCMLRGRPIHSKYYLENKGLVLNLVDPRTRVSKVTPQLPMKVMEIILVRA